MISLEIASVSVVEPARLDFGSIKEWADLYSSILGVEPDLRRRAHVPEKVIGFDRPIFIPVGLRLDHVWDFHDKIGLPKWKWWNGPLDLKISEADLLSVSQPRVIWVRDIQEAADPVEDLLAGLSAEEIGNRGIDTEGLLERMIHGIKYYMETGKLLDTRSFTNCAASRGRAGDVPCVGRDTGGEVLLFGCAADVSVPEEVRARRAIRAPGSYKGSFSG